VDHGAVITNNVIHYVHPIWTSRRKIGARMAKRMENWHISTSVFIVGNIGKMYTDMELSLFFHLLVFDYRPLSTSAVLLN